MSAAVELTYDGKVEDGKVTLWRRAAFTREVTRAFDGKPIVVIVKARARRRSNAQNRYWWGVVIQHLMFILMDFDPTQTVTRSTIHEWAKAKWLPTVTGEEHDTINTPSGVEKLPLSTTKLSTVQFMHLVQLVQQWSAQYAGVYIPDPDEMPDREVDIDDEP